MLSAQNTKIAVLFGLFGLTFLFSMIPVKIISMFKKQEDPTKSRAYKTAFSLMSCYAAGVFLATCLLDLLPGVKDKIAEGLFRAEIFTSFPVSEFVMVFGLFLILLTEQIVLQCKENTHGYQELPHHHHHHHDHHHHPHTENSRQIQRDSRRNRNMNTAYHTEGVSESIETDSDIDSDLDTRSQELTGFYEDPSAHSVIRSLILLVALSMHSVFEGLAVGLQPTAAKVIAIFAALTLHKCILAFSLGLNLVQSSLSLASIIRSNLLFALTSPAGIAIGIGITDLTKDMVAASLVNGIIQGLACGTFLYVTFFEILPHEFNVIHHIPSRMLKLLFLILGYGTVVGILFLHSFASNPKMFPTSI